MKYLIGLFSIALAFSAWADNRLELGNANGGHQCHSQWNQNNADDEFKHSCYVNLIQDGNDGSYSGEAAGSFLMEKSIINVPLPGKKNFSASTTTNCTGTQGTIQDDNGNAFTTGDCTTTLKFRGKPNKQDVAVTYRIVLRNATAAKAAKAVMAAGADEAGESIMFRDGMGY